MIITIPSSKDTYVTNFVNENNNGKNANVGHAATLDLFKLYNENKHAYSLAAFEFTQTLNDNDEIILKDAKDNTVTFIVDTTVNTTTGETDVDGKVILGLSAGLNSYASLFATTINNVSSFNNDLTLEITAYNNSNNELILTQNNSGESGDTAFTIPAGMQPLGGATITNFNRIDYSSVLINFDLTKFLEEWDKIVSEGALQGIFNSLKARIVLKDVTTGINKPYDYSLQISSLLKNFKEGLGRDTIYFSDSDKSNFISISDSDSWEVESFVSKNSDKSSTVLNTFSVEKGNEDLVFDVTDAIKASLVDLTLNKGFVVEFTKEFLFNKKSYFAKRLGSRHLLNKKLVPKLEILVNDSSSIIPSTTFVKKRFLNTAEDFFVYNQLNGKFLDFPSPDNSSLFARIVKKSDSTVIYADDIATNSINNIFGESLTGIKKFSLSATQLDKFNATIKSNISNNKLETKVIWYWKNNLNEEFVLKEENINFYYSENFEENRIDSLVITTKFLESDVNANNTVHKCSTYFIDNLKDYEAVSTPYDLPSENLGDVYYSLVDIDNNETVIDFMDKSSNNFATKMYYDGEKYIFNLFIPETLKNRRVNFVYKFFDPYTGNKKIVKNKSYTIRIR